jgi:hypothetical protein
VLPVGVAVQRKLAARGKLPPPRDVPLDVIVASAVVER